MDSNHQRDDSSGVEQRMRRLVDVPSPDLYRPEERIDWIHNPDVGLLTGRRTDGHERA